MSKKHCFIIAFLIIGFYNAYGQENPDINHFVIYWKGFDISIEEIYDMELFIKNHGKPIKIEYEDPHTFDDMPWCRLYYENVIFYFHGNYLWSYTSTNNGKYIYNIYIGMPQEEFLRIFGLENGYRNYFYEVPPDKTKYLQIYFENSRLSRIVWDDK